MKVDPYKALEKQRNYSNYDQILDLFLNGIVYINIWYKSMKQMEIKA